MSGAWGPRRAGVVLVVGMLALAALGPLLAPYDPVA